MLEEAAPEPAAVKRKAARRTKTEAAKVASPNRPAAPVPVLAAAPVAEGRSAAPKARARKAAKARVKAEPAAAVVAQATPVSTAPVPPAPSPRRPRGPVPLAAWAHAVDGRAEGRAPPQSTSAGSGRASSASRPTWRSSSTRMAAASIGC